MSEIPEDIKAAARAVLEFGIMETVEIKGVQPLLRNIERAIMRERECCAQIAETAIPNGKLKTQGVAHTAGHFLAAAIRRHISQAPSPNTPTPERVKR